MLQSLLLSSRWLYIPTLYSAYLTLINWSQTLEKRITSVVLNLCFITYSHIQANSKFAYQHWSHEILWDHYLYIFMSTVTIVLFQKYSACEAGAVLFLPWRYDNSCTASKKNPSLLYLLIAAWRIDGFMHFTKALLWSEIQTAWIRIWANKSESTLGLNRGL